MEALFEPGVLTTARDVMIVTWLHDGGLRVGGLCGLRFRDLHLIAHHPCGQRADPHVHIVGRDDNPNRARAKSYAPPGEHVSRDGYVVDGVIRAVSPDMISTFHAYLLDEYRPVQYLVDHEQVLVHGHGRTPGAALTTAAVRKMLRRACGRAGLSVWVTPHGFRHKAAAELYAASDFNAEMVAQEFGWASPEMVTDLYGRSANRHVMKYLRQAWEATARPGPNRIWRLPTASRPSRRRSDRGRGRDGRCCGPRHRRRLPWSDRGTALQRCQPTLSVVAADGADRVPGAPFDLRVGVPRRRVRRGVAGHAHSAVVQPARHAVSPCRRFDQPG